LVFTGEIRKAIGTLNLKPGFNEQLFESILFTEDEQLIQQISSCDWINNKYNEEFLS